MKFYRALMKKTGTEAFGVEKSPYKAEPEKEVSVMAGARQPTALVLAKGKKHLTKKEIKDRLDTEVAPCTDDLSAPSYLTVAEKTRFNRIALQLSKLGILGETDTETLARYITSQTQYEKTTKELRTILRDRPKKEDAPDLDTYYLRIDAWTATQERIARLQDRYFKQAQTAASALGLTISARCKLIAPKAEEAPKVNKFAKFGGEAHNA